MSDERAVRELLVEIRDNQVRALEKSATADCTRASAARARKSQSEESIELHREAQPRTRGCQDAEQLAIHDCVESAVGEILRNWDCLGRPTRRM